MKGREWYQDHGTASSYDEWRFSGGGRYVDDGEKDALLGLVGSVDGLEVLEVACGTGRFTVELEKRGADVVGIDISNEMLLEGVERSKREEMYESTDFIRGDGQRLPFPDDSFDLVVAMRFFHLVGNPVDYLVDMRRVSRSKVAFDTFMGPSFRSLYNRFLPMGSRLYRESEMRDVIHDADLELVDMKTDFFVPFGLYRSSPKAIGGVIRRFDKGAQSLIGDRLSSVNYWLAEK